MTGCQYRFNNGDNDNGVRVEKVRSNPHSEGVEDRRRTTKMSISRGGFSVNNTGIVGEQRRVSSQRNRHHHPHSTLSRHRDDPEKPRHRGWRAFRNDAGDDDSGTVGVEKEGGWYISVVAGNRPENGKSSDLVTNG